MQLAPDDGVVTGTNRLKEGLKAMRVILVLLGLGLLIVAGLLMTGMLSIDQTRSAVVQAPEFRADMGKVTVGSEKKTVEVPRINVEKAGNTAQPAQ